MIRSRLRTHLQKEGRILLATRINEYTFHRRFTWKLDVLQLPFKACKTATFMGNLKRHLLAEKHKECSRELVTILYVDEMSLIEAEAARFDFISYLQTDEELDLHGLLDHSDALQYLKYISVEQMLNSCLYRARRSMRHIDNEQHAFSFEYSWPINKGMAKYHLTPEKRTLYIQYFEIIRKWESPQQDQWPSLKRRTQEKLLEEQYIILYTFFIRRDRLALEHAVQTVSIRLQTSSPEFTGGSTAPQLGESRRGTISSTDLSIAKGDTKKKAGFLSSAKQTIQSWYDLAGDAPEMMIQLSSDLTRITNVAAGTLATFSSTAAQLNEILGANNQPEEPTLPQQTLPSAIQSIAETSGQFMLCAKTAQELLENNVKPIFQSAANDIKLLSERFAYALLAIIALVGLAVFEYYFPVNENSFIRMLGEITFLMLISILIGCFISKMFSR